MSLLQELDGASVSDIGSLSDADKELIQGSDVLKKYLEPVLSKYGESVVGGQLTGKRRDTNVKITLSEKAERLFNAMVGADDNMEQGRVAMG
jgi:hypothetical protein